MRSLPEIKAIFKAMNAAAVDRNVTVHRRARQADIYEKALRKITKLVSDETIDCAESCERVNAATYSALKRAEELK